MPGSISKEDGWHRYTTKSLAIEVTDVTLTGHSLRFVISRQHGSPPLLTKTTPTDITIVDDVATVAFDTGDYTDLEPGVYAGVLWDDTDDVQLWPQPQHSGDMYLSHGLAPV